MPPTGPQATVVLNTGVAYYVAEEVLCRLAFFASALRGGYKETLTKTIYLPEDNPDAVHCLIEYLHMGEYELPASMSSCTSVADGWKVESWIKLKLFHTSVFILAEKYLCVGLASIAGYKATKVLLPPTSLVNYIVGVYEMTDVGSRLRLAYLVEHGVKDETLILHPHWTTSIETCASVTRLLNSPNSEAKFLRALDQCPQLAIDLLSMVTRGSQPVPQTILQFPGAAKVILVENCKRMFSGRPWWLGGEVAIPWGWWKG